MQGSSNRGQTTSVSKSGDQPREMSRREYFDPTWGFGGDLFRMSPFTLLRMMTEQMDREFSGSPGQRQGSARSSFIPPLEVRRKGDNVIVYADLPGIDPKDVKVEVVEDMLTISGERKQEHEQQEGGFHRTERSYGNFYRSVQLPEGTKTDQAKASFNNGVLEITVPVEEPKENRRQIPIQGAAGSAQSGQAGGGGSKEVPVGSK